MRAPAALLCLAVGAAAETFVLHAYSDSACSFQVDSMSGTSGACTDDGTGDYSIVTCSAGGSQLSVTECNSDSSCSSCDAPVGPIPCDQCLGSDQDGYLKAECSGYSRAEHNATRATPSPIVMKWLQRRFSKQRKHASTGDRRITVGAAASTVTLCTYDGGACSVGEDCESLTSDSCYGPDDDGTYFSATCSPDGSAVVLATDCGNGCTGCQVVSGPTGTCLGDSDGTVIMRCSASAARAGNATRAMLVGKKTGSALQRLRRKN